MRKDSEDPWDDSWELVITDQDGFLLGIARSRMDAVDLMGDDYEAIGSPGNGSYRLWWRRK
jgi:hypothetical protein